MKIIAIAAALALLTTPAFAHPTKYVPLTLGVAVQSEATRPIPVQFDPDIVGYPANVTVWNLPHKRIWELCRNNKSYACTIPGAANGYAHDAIAIDEALIGKVRRIVLRHEFAHLLGYSH